MNTAQPPERQGHQEKESPVHSSRRPWRLGGWLILIIGSVASAADRPNILWITAEDMSPDLGCYGVDYARTPNLDRFATQGVRYMQAFATIGVCAPARSSIITGMYPTSIGTHHMRCEGRLPEFVRCFPEYLRNAGYYCTNNAKTDYNFKHPRSAWDESSNKAHWRNRKPGQPFFAVFNLGVTHESQTWPPTPEDVPGGNHDPAQVPLPPYHPDTHEVRRDWADYHDNISIMDAQFAAILQQLQEDGLAGDTIIFFYSDHGAGMPRSKRWLYDSSLRVPLIVRFPEKYKHLSPGAAGSVTDRLVSFVDLAPTVLSLAGVEIPAHMQGVAFLGERAGAPRQYIFGFRDRMDERYDMIRCVRDNRFKYLRNYYPQRPWFHQQHNEYANRMPTLRVWQEQSRQGSLNEVQSLWMAPAKPAEELYDTQADPWEIRNLAADPQYAQVLERMRQVHLDWVLETRDLGFLPEAQMRAKAQNRTEYEWARQSDDPYPLERIVETAQLGDRPKTAQELHARLKDGDAAVRYWAILGLQRKGKSAPGDWLMQIQGLMRGDPSWDVRIAAARTLAGWGKREGVLDVLGEGLGSDQEFVRLAAANAIDVLDQEARPLAEAMRQRLNDPSEYVRRVAEKAIHDLQ